MYKLFLITMYLIPSLKTICSFLRKLNYRKYFFLLFLLVLSVANLEVVAPTKKLFYLKLEVVFETQTENRAYKERTSKSHDPSRREMNLRTWFNILNWAQVSSQLVLERGLRLSRWLMNGRWCLTQPLPPSAEKGHRPLR